MVKVKRPRGVYIKQKLIDAINAVRSGKMTSVKASEKFTVPESTIRCHIRKPNLRVGAGRSFYLSGNEEKYLVELIKSFDDIGFRLTKPILNSIIGQYIGSVTTDARFTSKYLLFDLIVFFIVVFF
ncbi:unnamed protein product [Adineta steineri]|uniref:HTH psq-type domain-containing protein n=1 Tax=Adineta steineri TaxID=433720 RepID=A0A820E953_9BILA|nr:unnamed protein product [Adineta steineri]CAF4242747.1 unnamed protein product [Adineta steineri]